MRLTQRRWGRGEGCAQPQRSRRDAGLRLLSSARSNTQHPTSNIHRTGPCQLLLPPRRVFSIKAASRVVEIPTQVLESVDTLDELEDWLMARQPRLMRELRQARRDDLAGKFKAWKPRHLPCPTPPK